MVKDPGSRDSWGRRLVCTFGAASAGLLVVMLLAFLFSEFNGAVRGMPGWLVSAVLLLAFLGVGYAVYGHLRARDHYVLLTLLYSLPVLGIVSVSLLPELSRDDHYPADDARMVETPDREAARREALDSEARRLTEREKARREAEAEADRRVEEAARREALDGVRARLGEIRLQAEAARRAEEMRRAAAEMEARRQDAVEARREETAAVTRLERLAEERALEDGGREPAMPHFPWPPPQASGIEVLPTVFLQDQVSLGDVAVALDRALAWIGRHEIRFYSVPNGFAMVTRLEAIDEQGNTIADADRDEVDFLTYIRNLFWVPPGHYRMIVFVVTDQLFEASGTPLDRERADDLLRRGFIDLPASLSELPYTDRYRTMALIYEFRKERQSEVAQLLAPGRFTAHYHLDRIGWFVAAQAMPQMTDIAVLFPNSTAAGPGRR